MERKAKQTYLRQYGEGGKEERRKHKRVRRRETGEEGESDLKGAKITNMVTFLMKREHYLQMYAINLKSEMKQAIFSEI